MTGVHLMRNIVLIGNPIAGGGAEKKIKKAVNILKNKGCNVQLMLTKKRGDAEAFAKQISQEVRQEIVIAAGGDGTYNEVANGLIYSDIPMAILPLGTTSVLARELNIPLNIEKALDIAIKGIIQTVHLGRITLKKSNCSTVMANKLNKGENTFKDSSLVTRHFILMAGIGFDGEAVFGVSEGIKKYSGKGAYILSGLKALLKYNPSTIIIKGHDTGDMPHVPFSLTGYTAIVGKASCYGGNFKITPDARLTDPYFYIFVTQKKGRLNLLRYVSGIITGKHLHFKDITYFRAAKLTIEGHACIQIDGDYFGTTPAKIEIVPHALKLVMP